MPASPFNSPVRNQGKKLGTSGLFSGKPSAPVSNPKAVGGTAMRNALKSTRAQTRPKKG